MYSGVIWIPYCFLLLYLFYEHRSRYKFPQDLILLLLCISAVIRCIWYFCYGPYATYLTFIVLNRLAILFQFAAVSVLMTMWARALTLTSMADKMKQTNETAVHKTHPKTYHTFSSEKIRLLEQKHIQALVKYVHVYGYVYGIVYMYGMCMYMCT
ncbi:hypothetical protein EON63_09025 [archaeon]|nr:MAG: hypothetical protein EON63_09025 [archaeon]